MCPSSWTAMNVSHETYAIAMPSKRRCSECLAPSPGTPGEGRGEGSSADDDVLDSPERTLTLTLSRCTGRGDKSAYCESTNTARWIGVGYGTFSPLVAAQRMRFSSS